MVTLVRFIVRLQVEPDSNRRWKKNTVAGHSSRGPDQPTKDLEARDVQPRKPKPAHGSNASSLPHNLTWSMIGFPVALIEQNMTLGRSNFEMIEKGISIFVTRERFPLLRIILSSEQSTEMEIYQ
jgi:hypothetical protein